MNVSSSLTEPKYKYRISNGNIETIKGNCIYKYGTHATCRKEKKAKISCHEYLIHPLP